MKKVFHKRQPSFQLARQARNFARKGKNYNPDRYYVPRKVQEGVVISVPRYLQLDGTKDHSAVLRLVEDIGKWSLKENIRLEFGRCIHVHVQALIVLYAHLETILDRTDRKLIRISIRSLRGRVKTVVEASGIIDLLLGRAPINRDVNSQQLPIMSGNTTEVPPHDQIIDHIQQKVYGDLSPEVESALGDALSEVFVNVKDHAYPEELLADLSIEGRRWWAICSVFDQQLFLAIYDFGVGIPRTIGDEHWAVSKLRKKLPSDRLKSLLSSDGNTIGIAMVAGKNRRNEEKHGQGSISMHELVKQNPTGELWVYSGSGRYHWHHKQSQDEQEHSIKDYGTSIPGTLVQWNVKVE
ncbi:hypothetical protein [Gilvimarinus sp. 1_MG-2023]|uniref:hypothetical protein n=1 Tax=Gilvimarinus sp. 1_MG-2023 TaxID=3062638 RepID=UPI0026E15FB7|nr:hypothetical protein [Gilvimarinus sp. 1_MG-2023]MDO6747177.1 hypothetical protein [Gilvimarinus sp. 1_MG-2023]